MMNFQDAKLGMKVLYIPGHAKGDKKHPDCERGIITGIGAKAEDFVFVRYGDERHSKATSVSDLIIK
jgi:hypothetical protein